MICMDADNLAAAETDPIECRLCAHHADIAGPCPGATAPPETIRILACFEPAASAAGNMDPLTGNNRPHRANPVPDYMLCDVRYRTEPTQDLTEPKDTNVTAPQPPRSNHGLDPAHQAGNAPGLPRLGSSAGRESLRDQVDAPGLPRPGRRPSLFRQTTAARPHDEQSLAADAPAGSLPGDAKAAAASEHRRAQRPGKWARSPSASPAWPEPPEPHERRKAPA